jgi:hypothetical protein
MVEITAAMVRRVRNRAVMAIPAFQGGVANA